MVNSPDKKHIGFASLISLSMSTLFKLTNFSTGSNHKHFHFWFVKLVMRCSLGTANYFKHATAVVSIQ
jgi:hypothetical protein